MSKKKKVDWTIIPSLSELTGLIRSAEKLSQDIQENICKKIDDPNSNPKENMTLAEVSNYLMDIENNADSMRDGLEHILQLFHPGVSLDNMGVLGRKIKKSDIRYLTADPSLLYPIGATKAAYRCWYKDVFGFKTALIEDKKNFPKLSSWNINPAARIFINAFVRNTPSLSANKKNKYSLELIVAEFTVGLFNQIMNTFETVDKSGVFTASSGMEFLCQKKGKSLQTMYSFTQATQSQLTSEEIEMMNKKGLFDLDTLDFVKDELTLKKKFGI